MELQDLPDDVLIPIFQSTLLDDIFALRLTSRTLRTVIDAYITTIAPPVAAHTFPNSLFLWHRSPTHAHPSLQWLKSFIPAHLAAIALDKDKLRRYSYLDSGFPYGIPASSTQKPAVYWRTRVARGWRVLQRLHLLSARVYASSPPPPSRLSKLGSAVRCNRLGMLVACPYQACKEHATTRAFSGSYWKGSDAYLDGVRRKEEEVLRLRVELVKGLSDALCEEYVFVWRLLLWAFRPYRRPEEADRVDPVGSGEEGKEGLGLEREQHHWQAEISNISNGCSWLNWWVLHVGASVFWRQWWQELGVNVVRDAAWRDWTERTHHQVELEREFVSKFELAVRRRCLSVERKKRLEKEEWRGRVVKTISLDCIPWEYDQSPIIHRPPADFPWYEVGRWVWLDGRTWMMVGPGQSRLVYSTQRPDRLRVDEDDDENVVESKDRDPLEAVPYLIYLGTEKATDVWLPKYGLNVRAVPQIVF